MGLDVSRCLVFACTTALAGTAQDAKAKRRWPCGQGGHRPVLALVAALFIAISDAVQQRLAYDVTDKRVGAIALFSQLLRSPRWWLGTLVAAVGFTLQAAALGLGSVVLVQALFVTSADWGSVTGLHCRQTSLWSAGVSTPTRSRLRFTGVTLRCAPQTLQVVDKLLNRSLG